MQFTLFWIIDIGTWQTQNMETYSKYIFGTRTETRHKINEVYYSRGIYLFVYLSVFDYKAQFVSKKDEKCLRITIATKSYCVNIYPSMFGVLCCLLDRNLILGGRKINISIFSSVISTIFIFEALFWYMLCMKSINKIADVIEIKINDCLFKGNRLLIAFFFTCQ